MTPYYDEAGITIYHADCRDVLPTLGTVDLLVTDPPYGINYQSTKNNSHHGNPKLIGDDGTLDVGECIRLALKQLRMNRHFYIFGPLDSSQLTFGRTVDLVWDKDHVGMGDASVPWSPSHERLTFGVWTPFKSQEGMGGLATRLRRGSVLRIPTDNWARGAKYHPTAKPVLLMRHLIESSSTFGETVLDPFMGAGSTLIAARMEGRKAIGIEIEERYCETAVQRLAQGVLAFE